MYRDGFFCPMAKMVMGETAELLAEQYKISAARAGPVRTVFTTAAGSAQSSGRFDAEIAPVTIEGRKVRRFLSATNTFPRRNHEKMAKLVPVFSKTGHYLGRKFVGGSPMVLRRLSSPAKTLLSNTISNRWRESCRYLRRSRSPHHGNRSGPGHPKDGSKHGLKLADFDLIELNEAFAAQVLACGANCISIATSSTSTEARSARPPHRLHRCAHHCHAASRNVKRKSKRGLATLCVSGGMGMALAIENAA